MSGKSEVEFSAVVVCRDDEERAGHMLRRLAAHLRSLGLHFEILAVDEASTDNTLSLLSLLRRDLPELRVVAGVQPGRGYARGLRLAHGQAVLLVDARCEAPWSALGFALNRVGSGEVPGEAGYDALAVSGRYLVVRRTRTLAAADALGHHRDALDLERRFMRRARALGLRVDVAASRARPGAWARLRQSILLPLASRF